MIRRHSGYRIIHSIKIQNYRCFQELTITGCRRFNVIVGENGAGKTALLEAIFLALGSSPTLPVRYRQQRGLDGTFSGTPHNIEEALWRDLFYRGQWDVPISIETKGDGLESRSVTISRAEQKELVIPFEDVGKPSDNRPAPLQLRWRNSVGIERVYIPRITQQGFAIDGDEEALLDFFYFAANQTSGSTEAATRFSEISRAGHKSAVVSAIKKEYDWIEDLNIEILGGLPVVYAILKNGYQFPLANISGGVNRIVSIILSIASRYRSVVLVDEIEDGIYYKQQPTIWQGLAALVRSNEGQLFITTHNEEWLEAVFTENDEDVALWRLIRQGNTPKLIQFTGKQAAAALQGAGEVR